jgi:chromosome segregation ATPase
MTPEERFERIEANLERVTERLDRVGERLDRVGERLNGMTDRMDAFEVTQELEQHRFNERANHFWKAHAELMEAQNSTGRNIEAMREVQRASAEIHDRQMAELRELHKGSEFKLNALIDGLEKLRVTMDQFLKGRGGNGHGP